MQMERAIDCRHNGIRSQERGQNNECPIGKIANQDGSQDSADKEYQDIWPIKKGLIDMRLNDIRQHQSQDATSQKACDSEDRSLKEAREHYTDPSAEHAYCKRRPREGSLKQQYRDVETK